MQASKVFPFRNRVLWIKDVIFVCTYFVNQFEWKTCFSLSSITFFSKGVINAKHIISFFSSFYFWRLCFVMGCNDIRMFGLSIKYLFYHFPHCRSIDQNLIDKLLLQQSFLYFESSNCILYCLSKVQQSEENTSLLTKWHDIICNGLSIEVDDYNVLFVAVYKTIVNCVIPCILNK